MRVDPLPSPAVRASTSAPSGKTARRLSREERLGAAGGGLGLLALLGVARWLEPDPAGVGTHTQLGLPPTFVMDRLGTPCPLCGMTTAWAHTMEANLLAAVLTQPAGALLALLAMLAVPVLFGLALTGWRPAWFGAPGVWTWTLRLGVGVLAAGWLYKLWAVWAGFPA